MTPPPLLDPQLNKTPGQINHIHIMGICGTGMAAMAGMLQESGYTISGSDKSVYPPMSDFLAQLGIKVADGYSAGNLNPAPDLVIVGNVITRKNPEALELARLQIPYLSMPQALGHFFLASRTSLVVAGTHGKTTTSSLLTSALCSAKQDPSCLIGGIVRELNSNFRIGKGDHFVVEGDEYDTAFFDKGSKFLHYQPKIAIITSIEFDHADIFADLEAIKSSFRKFIDLLPDDGLIIAYLDDPVVREMVASAPCEVQGYGSSPSLTWSLDQVKIEAGMSQFSILHKDKPWAEMSIQLPGKYNCLNALAVIAVLRHLGLNKETITKGLHNFGGVKRRQEVRGIEHGITVIDDFAHHPTAVRETLTALKEAYGNQRLIAIFEPRTNSSRRSIFQTDYISSFAAADMVLIKEPIPLDNVLPEDHMSAAKLANDLKDQSCNAAAFPGTDAILSHIIPLLKSGDVVAVLSNGGFDNIHIRLLDGIRAIS